MFFRRIIINLFILFVYSLEAYDLGRGYTLSDTIHLGGYFSTDYSVSKKEKRFRVDDVAFIAYGSITNKFSYLVELEAAPVYTYEFKNDIETNSGHFHRERLYLDYKQSDSVNIRIGKQITPVGYWNLEPINVLRETSSNPIISRKVFPKFLSGIDIYGYLPQFEAVKYHIFGQKNKDIDEEYINIKNEHFFGASLENESYDDFQYGGSIGEFINEGEDRSRFIGLNFKYTDFSYEIQSEMIFSRVKSTTNDQTYHTFASYLQSLYRFDMNHALVGRYEYAKDNKEDYKQHIGVFGYSYRPVYSVSFKGEYQWNSDADFNKFVASFSVLF